AGRLPFTAHLLALRVDHHQILGFDETLVAARRRTHDVSVGKPHADVAVGRSNELFLINEMADAGDFLPQPFFRHGRLFYRIVSIRVSRWTIRRRNPKSPKAVQAQSRQAQWMFARPRSPAGQCPTGVIRERSASAMPASSL